MSLAKTIRCLHSLSARGQARRKISPILFSLYLNDLESFLEQNQTQGVNTELKFETESETYLKILILLYADDTVLLAESQEQLQQTIYYNFKSYCDQWNLKVNLTKTKIIVFGTNKSKQFSFKFGNESIEIISKYEYLGVVFASTGSYIHAKNI